MGVLNSFERRCLEALYGRSALYRCNKCTRPIWSTEIPIVDPKGGYFKLPPSVNTFGSKYSKPKVTYCRECDLIRRGKVVTDAPTEKAVSSKEVRIAIIKLIRAKPKKEWTNGLLIRKFAGTYEAPMIREAIKVLRRKGRLVRKQRRLVLVH